MLMKIDTALNNSVDITVKDTNNIFLYRVCIPLYYVGWLNGRRASFVFTPSHAIYSPRRTG